MDESQHAEITPLKIGIRTNPPVLTLIYEICGKNRQRYMPVRFLNKYGSVDNLVKDLKERHCLYLEKVSDLRIKKLLKILQEVQKGTDVITAAEQMNRRYGMNPEQDLNFLSDEELAIKKMVMEESFIKNQLKPGDEGFIYDKQADFEKKDEVCGWDSDGEFWE